MFGWLFNRPRTVSVSKVTPITNAAKAAGLTKERTVKAYIAPTGKKTGLYASDGTLISTYSRERDATRGAARRNLTVIPAPVA
jgi:hypothetical protein